ncbi:MAG: hypothetical protein E3J83_06300 [Candidatus Atribacteria bacterium]|nr:MAG: hypothetical protein E3J83_06300 [Candidatus Atribacteria bacterium]
MKDFRPDILKFLDKKSTSNFLKLVKDTKDNKCSLVFGAGVAASVGLPVWDTLIIKICLAYYYHWIFDIVHKKNITYENPPTNTPMGFTQAYDFYLQKKRLQELLDTMKVSFKIVNKTTQIYINEKLLSPSKTAASEKFYNDWQKKIDENIESFMEKVKDFDPILIAQMIKNRIRITDWNYLVRKCLYSSYEDSPYKITSSELFKALIELIKTIDISEIINLNYDDTFYHILRKNNLNFKNIYSEISFKNSVKRIYYPHGYLPLYGGVVTKLILSEEDYQEESFKFDNWANNMQSSIYNNSSCIFIGLSLTDPNLRRILKSCTKSLKFNHYAFLPTDNQNKSKTQIMIDSLFNEDLNRLGIKVIRYPLINKSDRYCKLPYLINFLTRVLNNEIQLF